MSNTNQSTIHLQSIGKVPAKPAGELQVGDRTIWNFGYIEVVESVELRGKSVYVTLRDTKSGQSFPHTFRQTRLVAMAAPDAVSPRALPAIPAPETSATIPANIPGIDYSAATLYGIAPYGNYGFEIVKPDNTAEVFNYSKDRNTNYWYAVIWAEKHTPQLDYVPKGDDNVYPRDTIVYEAEWWRADLTPAERLDRVSDEVIAAWWPEEDLTVKIASAVARRDLDEGKAWFEMFNAEPLNSDARNLRDTHTRTLVQYGLIERETGIPADGDEVEAFYWLRYGRPPYPAIPAEPRQLSLFA